MRLLSLFLYITLFICISWGTLVLAGPKLLQAFIDYHFGESLKIDGIKVHNNLDIEAVRVTLKGDNFKKKLDFSGQINSVYFDWNLISSRPGLNMSFFAGSMENGATFAKVSTLISPTSVFDFSNYEVDILANNLRLSDSIFLENISVKSYFDLVEKRFFQLISLGEGISYNNGDVEVEVSSFEASIDQHQILKPIDLQENRIEMSAIDIFFNGKMVTAVPSVKLNITNQQGSVLLKAEKSNIDALDRNLRLSEVTSSLLFETQTKERVISGEVSVDRAEFDFPNAELEEINIKFAMGKYWSEVSAAGLVDRVELVHDENFYGTLQNALIAFKGHHEVDDTKAIIDFSASLSSRENIPFAAKVSVDVRMNEARSILECLVDCKPGNVFADYGISTSSGQLNGMSECLSENCLNGNFNHAVEITNLNSFFSDLAKTNFFNPIALAFLFSEVTKWEKDGFVSSKKF